MRLLKTFLLTLGLALLGTQLNAADIVHDAEFYILEKQNAERWAKEDKALDQRLADFRKNNGEAIRLVCREFVMLCRKLNLFSDAFVAMDGSKFRSVNNRNKSFSKAKIKALSHQIDASIERTPVGMG